MILTIDIGATKVLLAVFTQNGLIKETLKFATPENYPDLIDEIKNNLNKLKLNDYSCAIVAVPGKLDRINGIGLAFGNRDWTNVPIASDIEKITNCPVRIENDTKLAALSEAILIIKDYKKVLYVTISTGISSGLIINGVIDPDLADSESGHMRLPYKGKLEIWQKFASGKAIVKKYGKRASDIEASDKKTWNEIAYNISLGLIELISVIQPEVIILGGGVGTHFQKYKEPLLKELKKYEIPLVPIPPIKKAIRPEEAVIYGCYELSKQLFAHVHSNK